MSDSHNSKLAPLVSHTGAPMPILGQNLILSRCPHCAVANPNLSKSHNLETTDFINQIKKTWVIYTCATCGGLVSAWAPAYGKEATAYFPHSESPKDDIPDRPRAFLHQAMESLHAPAGAVMLAGSAVDSMLKLKGYTDGSLYKRIESAVTDGLITSEMAKWAHEVRLDANDQRHADEDSNLPSPNDAKRAIEFASAFAEYLFVLPSRIQRGISKN